MYPHNISVKKSQTFADVDLLIFAMEIITKRFLLRDFIQDDLPAFTAYHKDPRSLEFYGIEEAKPNHAQELFQVFKTWSLENPRRNYQLAIVKRELLQLIGCCGLRCNDSEDQAELGIELAPQYWGRYKYALEIMSSLAEFGFGSLGLKTIYGSTVSANNRIMRLAKFWGAIAIEHPTPDWMVARGWSKVEWQITKQQWESNHLS